jgi:hypothetical protein
MNRVTYPAVRISQLYGVQRYGASLISLHSWMIDFAKQYGTLNGRAIVQDDPFIDAIAKAILDTNHINFTPESYSTMLNDYTNISNTMDVSPNIRIMSNGKHTQIFTKINAFMQSIHSLTMGMQQKRNICGI